MDSSPIAPVIPPASRRAGREHLAGRAVRRLPLADSLPGPSRLHDVVYGLARMDASGRVTDRALTSALGWRDGERLDPDR